MMQSCTALKLLKSAFTVAPQRTFCLRSHSYTASSDPEQVKAAFSYCIQQVRKYDSSNYVWMVQLPTVGGTTAAADLPHFSELRRPIFALRAFNIETVLIGDQMKSKEGPLVMIRFQWWRDAIDAMFKGQIAPKHPVVLALQTTLEQQQQSEKVLTPQIKKYNLKRILDTREEDLLDAQPPLSLGGLETYAEGSASQLLYLQLAAAGVASKEADHAASHLGKAVGITTLLKGTAYHASTRRSYLPLDICAELGVSQEDVYSGNVTEGLRDAVLRVASTAKAHLDEARVLQAKLPMIARHLMLPALQCDAFLKSLEAKNFDPFDPSLAKGGASPLWHVLQVKWHLLAKTY